MGKHHKKYQKGKDSGSLGGGWEIVYSGFVLILLCFFIMLSSFASIEQGKVIRFVKSFVNALSILSGGIKFDPGERVVRESEDIVDKEDPLAQVFQSAQELSDSPELKGKIDVTVTSRGIVMRIRDTVLFELGVAEISSEAFPLMKEISSIVSKVSQRVSIEGHTDNLPIRTGKFPSNWELSTARAVNVLRYFTEKEGISPKKLFAVGFSEYRPLFPNDKPENRARNRRVEIVFLRNSN